MCKKIQSLTHLYDIFYIAVLFYYEKNLENILNLISGVNIFVIAL